MIPIVRMPAGMWRRSEAVLRVILGRGVTDAAYFSWDMSMVDLFVDGDCCIVAGLHEN